MAMTFDGNGTITGLAAGGLPNGTVQPADLSTGAPTWDTSGNLLVGTTSNSDFNTNLRFYVNTATQYGGVFKTTFGSTGLPLGIWNTAASGSIGLITFYTDTGNARGSITSNGSTVAYNTSSDYRLKESVQPMIGALAKVAALKPCTYIWKSNGIAGEGFIAHELQAVVPDCVTGEKDAVDSDGNPVYQGIDTSFLVATLTAAIQELNAKVDAQAAEIAALKGQA